MLSKIPGFIQFVNDNKKRDQNKQSEVNKFFGADRCSVTG
jgi:hypothetical protein